MDIDNIVLSATMLKELYPDCLVRVKKPEKPPVHAETVPDQGIPESAHGPESAGRVQGRGLKRVFLIFSHPESALLPDKQLAFLNRMLEACHCPVTEVSLINAAHTPVDIPQLISRLNPEIILLSGVSPAALNLRQELEPFVVKKSGGISILLIPSLTSLSAAETDGLKQTKKQLWTSLQTLFKLKS